MLIPIFAILVMAVLYRNEYATQKALLESKSHVVGFIIGYIIGITILYAATVAIMYLVLYVMGVKNTLLLSHSEIFSGLVWVFLYFVSERKK